MAVSWKSLPLEPRARFQSRGRARPPGIFPRDLVSGRLRMSHVPSRWSRCVALVAAALALALPGRGARADDLRPVPDVLGRARADAVAAVSAQGFLVAVYEVSGSP